MRQLVVDQSNVRALPMGGGWRMGDGVWLFSFEKVVTSVVSVTVWVPIQTKRGLSRKHQLSIEKNVSRKTPLHPPLRNEMSAVTKANVPLHRSSRGTDETKSGGFFVTVGRSLTIL